MYSISTPSPFVNVHTAFDVGGRWLEFPGFLSDARTSPRDEEAKYSHAYQQNEIRRAVCSFTHGIEPLYHVDEIGVHGDGDHLTFHSRPGLFRLIELAKLLNFPIVVWDWSRLVADYKSLPKLAQFPVTFITLKPLTATRRELHGERIRLAKAEGKRQRELGGDDVELGRFLSREFTYTNTYQVNHLD